MTHVEFRYKEESVTTNIVIFLLEKFICIFFLQFQSGFSINYLFSSKCPYEKKMQLSICWLTLALYLVCRNSYQVYFSEFPKALILHLGQLSEIRQEIAYPNKYIHGVGLGWPKVLIRIAITVFGRNLDLKAGIECNFPHLFLKRKIKKHLR